MTEQWRKRIFLTVGFIALLLFIINRIFFFKKGFLEKIASNLTYPVIVLSSKIATPFRSFLQKRKSYNEFLAKYKKVKEENDKLIAQNIKLKATLYYDKLSCDLLDFQKRYKLETAILAKILTKKITLQEHYFLINRGYKDGIRKDMIAIYKFQIIGKVTQVYRWHSKILPITDKNCKIASYTNSTYAQGIVVGKNKKDYCQMKYVSYLAKIAPDDFIISSGQGLIFPEGFCLGKIAELKTKGPYHKIKVKPLINFDDLKFCLLINQEKIDAF